MRPSSVWVAKPRQPFYEAVASHKLPTHSLWDAARCPVESPSPQGLAPSPLSNGLNPETAWLRFAGKGAAPMPNTRSWSWTTLASDIALGPAPPHGATLRLNRSRSARHRAQKIERQADGLVTEAFQANPDCSQGKATNAGRGGVSPTTCLRFDSSASSNPRQQGRWPHTQRAIPNGPLAVARSVRRNLGEWLIWKQHPVGHANFAANHDRGKCTAPAYVAACTLPSEPPAMVATQNR